MTRVSIVVAGLGHGLNPVPAASRVGPLLATGGVRGVDPATGLLPEAIEDEVRQMFDNLVSVLAAGGASVDDVAHLTVFAADSADSRQWVNDAWTRLFPDESSRPARHFLRHDLPSGMRVQVEALAYVTAGAGPVTVVAGERPADVPPEFDSVDSCALSDALDRLGLTGVALGLSRLSTSRAIRGRVITVRIGPKPESSQASARHLGTSAVEAVLPGDVIVIANGGRTDVAAWGGTLAAAAVHAGVAGIVIDGAFRDRDECEALGLAVYARTAVPVTARGRVVEEAWNVPISVCGITVEPGDYVVADGSGVVFLPAGELVRVTRDAVSIMDRERAMSADVQRGEPVSKVMGSSYETMLEEGEA